MPDLWIFLLGTFVMAIAMTAVALIGRIEKQERLAAAESRDRTRESSGDLDSRHGRRVAAR